MKIRKATKEDLNGIIRLNQMLFDYEYKHFDKTLDCSWPKKNKKYFSDAITKSNSLTLVAVDNEKIIGYFIGSINFAEDYKKEKKVAEIDNMLILPQYQKKKIGSLLCKEFFKWTKKKNVKRVRVVASAKNKKAINFYKKNKFLDYNLTLEKNL